MNEILSFLSTYRLVLAIILILLSTTIILINWWDEIKLYWKSTYYSLPLIGKIKQLYKRTARSHDGWFQSEKVLCEDFYSDIKKIANDPDMYDKAKSYLLKVQEYGRKNLSIFMWIVIIALVFVESLGFAYILSGYTLPGASEGLQVKGALGIAFLISAVLVWLTHSAGAEMHKRELIKKAREWSHVDNSKDKPPLKQDMRVTIENNADDDGSRDYIQLLNRLAVNGRATAGTPIWTMITFFAIFVIGIGATVVRYETYKQEKISETSFVENGRNGELSLESLLENVLPQDLVAPQQDADSRANQEKEDAADTANLTTFTILGILFVLIQAMGIGIGHRYGFAGKESKVARQIIGNFKSRSEYETWYERKKSNISLIAQKHLTNLQSKMRYFSDNNGIDQTERDALMNSAQRTFEIFFITKHKAEKANDNEMAELQSNTKTPTLQEKIETPTEVPVIETVEETQEEMEARLRAEILAKMEADKSKVKESEDEMRARLLKELSADA